MKTPHIYCVENRLVIIRGMLKKFCNSTIKKNGNVTNYTSFSMQFLLSTTHLRPVWVPGPFYNRPTSFPGRVSYEATEPGLACALLLGCLCYT